MCYVYIVGIALILSVIMLALKLNKYKKMWNSENVFLAGLTHDLKNPANAQISIFNMLLAGKFGQLTQEQSEIIELTKNSSVYISSLVENILTSYKLYKGNMSLSKSNLDLEKLVLSVCSENIYQAKNKNLQIIYTPKCRNCFVFGDALQIKRVIENLLSNAINYSLPGGKIEIQIQKEIKYFDISVKNFCLPVPDEELKFLFKPFGLTCNSKFNSTSSGLGLYVSKNIVQMHNGHIYSKKISDNSMVFGFKLPRSADSTKTSNQVIPKKFKETIH